MDVLVAPVTDNQGLATARGHSLDPCRSLCLSRSIQIRETADVVNLEGSIFRAAVLACLCKEALDDF